MEPEPGRSPLLPMLGRGLLLSAALAMEGKAVWEFFHPQPVATWLPTVLLLHGMACLALGLFAAGSPADPDPGRIAFAFAFSLFLPGLGMPAVLLVVLPGLLRASAIRRIPYVAIARSFPEDSGEAYPTRYGPGGFRARLLSRRIPASARLHSLLAVRQRATPGGNRLMKEMLKDPADELRLMAYGTLERREMEFQEAIARARDDLRMAGDDRQRSLALRRLAFLHWEMAYQELVEGELSRFYLEQALDAARQALEMGSEESASLWVLTGRIQARLGAWEEAWQALDKAERLGTPMGRVTPHLAELAFLRKDFSQTRHLLSQMQAAGQTHGMETVLRFWLGRGA